MSAENPSPVPFERFAELESHLMTSVNAASFTLCRAEFLDDEQRAEVYAILQALRHEGQSHLAILAALSREVAHA
jgi:hypothetical protein